MDMNKFWQAWYASVAFFCLPTLVSAGGLSFKLKSPLKIDASAGIEGLIKALLNILLVIAIPIIVFFIIYAGFSYVTAQGNPEKIKVATRSLTYAIIGAVLILGATALTQVVTGIVDGFK